MIFEFLSAISAISACIGPKISTILNCDIIRPGNDVIEFARPMEVGDEIIFTGRFLEADQLVENRTSFDLVTDYNELAVHLRIDFDIPDQQNSKILINSFSYDRLWKKAMLMESPFESGQVFIIRVTAVLELRAQSNGIIMRFKIDFETESQPSRITLNSQFVDEPWQEEQVIENPFSPGQALVIHIKKLNNNYEVDVGHGVSTSFAHRLDQDDGITGIKLKGDWTVTKVEV
ncbi:unnamed protein product [Caenorhabditis bovis]|uniref:Galectin n=1 Tax=Caenorhabditis bovis TaxID=2654633 RepID=A0A8S1EM82_9PELO|nr:unnamed protein product [Caenorhabditis bovis]